MHPSSAEPSSVDVAIIGAGFCGTLVAVNLLLDAKARLDIALIERSGRFGRGLAYGTTDHSHLLNVPAGKMGAFPDDQEHFFRWLLNHPDALRQCGVGEPQPGSFLPRALYGRYLSSLLDEAENHSAQGPASHHDHCASLRRLSAEATDVAPQPNGLFTVKIRNQPDLIAKHVVLALGNFPPGDPKLRDQRFHRDERYLENPWSTQTKTKLAEAGDVLILGSGLTALDLLLSLAPEKKSGCIYLLSRRGIFPKPHRAVKSYQPFLDKRRLPKTARRACRAIRSQIRGAEKEGFDWRAVVDAVRPFSQQIWQQWPVEERRRFLRHLKPFWEPHRHRAAPEVLDFKSRLEQNGRLKCYRGRVLSITAAGTDLKVCFRDPPTGIDKQLRVRYVVNCTGPECNYHKLKDPLVIQLFSRGIIVPDPLFLGLDVGLGGTILNLQGERINHLYTLGSPQKGILFETTAVPELRIQAADLACRILSQLEHRRKSHAIDQTNTAALASHI